MTIPRMKPKFNKNSLELVKLQSVCLFIETPVTEWLDGVPTSKTHRILWGRGSYRNRYSAEKLSPHQASY